MPAQHGGMTGFSAVGLGLFGRRNPSALRASATQTRKGTIVDSADSLGFSSSHPLKIVEKRFPVNAQAIYLAINVNNRDICPTSGVHFGACGQRPR